VHPSLGWRYSFVESVSARPSRRAVDLDEGDSSRASKAESLCDAMRSQSQVSRCEVPISNPATHGKAKPRGDDRRPTTASAPSGSCAGGREVDGARQGLLPGVQLVYGTSHAGWRAGKPGPASSPGSLSRFRGKCNRSATIEFLVGTAPGIVDASRFRADLQGGRTDESQFALPAPGNHAVS
jgi:hypothetical protein